MSTSPAPHVTLQLPGLFRDLPSQEDDVFLKTGTLKVLLARADRADGGLPGFESRLFGLFGITPSVDGDVPVAPVTRLADMGIIDGEWWARADPVYLEAGHDSLVLHAGLKLTQAEAAVLADEINEVLVADGWLLKAPRPGRWYVKPPRPAQIRTTPLSQAAGRDVQALLPAGPEGRAWHTRLSELQILLHTSSVNAAREARGLQPANSVWFWGGGRLPQPGSADWAQVWSNEPVASGLARLAGLSAETLPENGAEWLKRIPPFGNCLVVLDQLMPDLLRGDPHGWREALLDLDAAWVAPLVAAVTARQLAGLTLTSDSGPIFSYRRTHRWRFWRRSPARSDQRGVS
jgi:hypothetical protein